MLIQITINTVLKKLTDEYLFAPIELTDLSEWFVANSLVVVVDEAIWIVFCEGGVDVCWLKTLTQSVLLTPADDAFMLLNADK